VHFDEGDLHWALALCDGAEGQFATGGGSAEPCMGAVAADRGTAGGGGGAGEMGRRTGRWADVRGDGPGDGGIALLCEATLMFARLEAVGYAEATKRGRSGCGRRCDALGAVSTTSGDDYRRSNARQ